MNQFQGFSQQAFEYLVSVKLHNSKAWYEENKHIYKKYLYEPFAALIRDLTPVMKQIDEGFLLKPTKCLSRIRRDTRFSRDKTLYRDTMWFYIRRSEFSAREGVGYYFEISPDAAGHGLCMGFSSPVFMERFRKAIRSDIDAFKKVINAASEIDGISIGGALYKKDRGEGLPPELKQWYNRKEIYVQVPCSFEDITSSRLVHILSDSFIKLKPLYYFLLNCI